MGNCINGIVLFLFCSLLCLNAQAATYYLDNSVSTSGNGLSWSTAWKNVSNITGLQPGDTVYISGGSASQAYTVSDRTPTGGSSGHPITYAVGQEAGHNGVVTITATNFLNGTIHDVVIDGNVGGQQHWSVTPSNYFWEGGSGTNQRVTLQYITVPNMGAGFHWSSAGNTALEIHHCRFVKTSDSSNIHDFIFFGGGGQLSVHDNYIQFPYATFDHSFGDDMWIWPSGVSFYNNTVKGSPITYSWDQHSDVFQASLESNMRIYNNTFIDTGESLYYEDSQSAGTVSGLYIYNNLIMRTFACNGGAQRIFDLNPENGGLHTAAYIDVVIANNTIVDQQSPCIFFTRVSGAGSYTRTFVVNNIQYPSDSSITTDNGVTVSNNYAGTGIQFVSYAHWGGTNNDLHLTAVDTAVIGQGRNMSTYFTTDKDGNLRDANWDIGAYEFGSGTTMSPCDVNKDNTTNIVDVQQCVNQSLGVATCTADINKDGICNVVDVQRVVNAALGGQCVTN